MKAIVLLLGIFTLFPGIGATQFNCQPKCPPKTIGPTGPTGPRGEKGKRGHHGARGFRGVTGPTGGGGLVTYGYPYVLWVDGNTTAPVASQNGTLSNPFSTIQAAINLLETFPTPGDSLDDLARGWTVMIADAHYIEDVTINGDNRIIFLLTVGNALIGDPQNDVLSTITVNYCNNNAGTKELPAFLFLGAANSIGKGFTFYGNIIVNNNGLTGYGGIYGNIFDPARSGVIKVNGTGPVNLFLISSVFSVAIEGNSLTTLSLAQDCTFGGDVTVNDYGLITGCTFNHSATLTVTSDVPPPLDNPNVIVQTYIGPGSALIPLSTAFIFQLDAYTNFWVNKYDPSLSQKFIINAP